LADIQFFVNIYNIEDLIASLKVESPILKIASYLPEAVLVASRSPETERKRL